jgi:hypothetical protein
LTLLRELENDHLARTKTALRIKKEEEASGHAPRPGGVEPFGEASENLRTIEIEVRSLLVTGIHTKSSNLSFSVSGDSVSLSRVSTSPLSNRCRDHQARKGPFHV